MPDGYLDEMNERVRRVNAETVSMFAAESARLLASTCDRFEMAATRGALVEIFREVKLSELLPDHIDLVVENFARLYGLKGGFGPNARPTITMLLGEHLPAIIAALTVSFSYLVFLMMSSPVGFDWQKALIDFAIADSRSAAVWAAYEMGLNVRPSVVVGGIWIAAFTGSSQKTENKAR